VNTYLLVSSTLNFLAAAIQIGILLSAMERNPLRNRYLLFLVSLAAWSGTYTLWRLSDNPDSAYFYSQLLISCASFEPVAFFHFCLALSGLKAPRLVALGYGLSLLFMLATSMGLIVEEVKPIMGHDYWPMAGKLMPYYLLHFNGYLVAGIIILIRGWRANIGGRASDHMLVLFSAVIGFIGGGTNFPLWYEVPIQPFGNILVSIYLFLMLHGIYKKRIFGLSIDFYKLLVGLVLNSSVTLFIMLFYGLYRSKTGESIDLLTIWIYSIYVFFASALIFWIVPKIKVSAERIIDGALRNERMRPLSELSNLSSDIANIVSEEAMFDEVAHRLRSSLKVSWVAVYRLDFLGKAYTCRTVHGKRVEQFEAFTINSTSPLVDHLAAEPESLLFEQIYSDMEDDCYRQLVDLKNSTGACLIVPIHVSQELSGMLLFGSFDQSRLPSSEEMAILSYVGSQIGLNLRIREFQRRTSEVDKLVALGTMAAGLSHEIRNPLVSVQTLASLLKDGRSLSKISGDYKNVLIRDIRRIESIVDGVASYSKNQKARNMVITIHEVVESSMSIYDSQVKEQGVILNFKKSFREPVSVLGNFDQLVQVFNNLIENAIHAVEAKDEQRIDVEMHLQESTRSTSWVAITVTDSGDGVPESIIKRIFDPFITSKDTGQREEKVGMGLGLAISKRIIENHDGLITVTNLATGGAKFTVSLQIHNS
jgi:two-component system nitrogen regulation sensor histidine kinase GlnL